MHHNTQLLRAAVTASLMLVAIAGAAVAGSLRGMLKMRALEKTMQPPFGFCVRWPNKATPPRSHASGICMRTAMACRRITPKQCCGIAALLTKALR
jgi:hypothetical protein